MLRGRLAGGACSLLSACLLASLLLGAAARGVSARSAAQRPQREQETRPVPVDATAPAGARTVQNRSKSMCQCAAVMRSMPQRQWGVVSSAAARADNGCDGGICLNFQLKHDANTRD